MARLATQADNCSIDGELVRVVPGSTHALSSRASGNAPCAAPHAKTGLIDGIKDG